MTPDQKNLAILERAYRRSTINPQGTAEISYAELRAAVYAVTPGKQSKKNLEAALHTATLAVARVVRRRAAK